MKFSSYLVQLWQSDRAYFLLITATILLPWGFSGVVGWLLAEEIPDFSEQPGFVAGFFMITTLTMAVGFTPTTLVSTAAGYFFGWHAFGWVVISYLAAAVLGRKIGVVLNLFVTGSNRFINPKANQFFTKLAHQPFLLLVFCRLSPVLTFALTNVALGRMPFRMTTYTLATLLGMLPRTLLVFYAGTRASEWNQAFESGHMNHLKIAVVIGLLLISVVGIGWLSGRALQRVTNE